MPSPSKENCCGTDTQVTVDRVMTVFAEVPPIMVAPYGSGLKCLEFTLLPDTPIVIHDDGSIEYAPRDLFPPEISGYTRDSGNPFLFHPKWPLCEQRYHGTKMNKEGFIDVIMLCDCKDVPQYRKQVCVEECLHCPMVATVATVARAKSHGDTPR